MQSPAPIVPPPPLPSCSTFEDPSKWNLALSLLLTVGIVVSYLPQHVRVVKRRSSEGISPWFLLLGVLSGICAVCNIWILGGPVYKCCKEISTGNCMASSLGIAQITLQAFSASLILILVLIFARQQPFESPDEYATMQLVGQISLVSFLLSVLVSFYVYFSTPHSISSTANVFGLAGAALAIVQYFPQIYTTATLQHVGTLSIPMMCMQTPGGYLWAWSLAQRNGTSWSSWLPYFTAAFLQNILLFMAVYFETRDRREARKRAREQGPTSTDPLLG